MLRDGNRGLQAQLKDTVEAVQAASELPFRLKEAKELAINERKRILMVEPKADPMDADSNIDDKTKSNNVEEIKQSNTEEEPKVDLVDVDNIIIDNTKTDDAEEINQAYNMRYWDAKYEAKDISLSTTKSEANLDLQDVSSSSFSS